MKAFLKRACDKILHRTSRYIMGQQFAQACRRAQRELPRYLPRVNAFLDKQKDGGLHYPRSAFQLLELAFVLERAEPRVIVECGSGTTTCVISEYAVGRDDVTFISLDDSQHYLDKTLHELPQDLQHVPTMTCAERIVEIVDGEEMCYYGFDHGAMPVVDFLYVDGPANVSPTDRSRQMRCIDSIKFLEAGVRLNHVLFDNRLTSVRYLLDSPYGPYYDVQLYDSIVGEMSPSWHVGPTYYHSHFKLRPGARLPAARGAAQVS